jgi:hypothetical protein
MLEAGSLRLENLKHRPPGSIPGKILQLKEVG